LDGQCYISFTIILPNDPQPRFLQIADRKLVAISHKILCSNRPERTYLRDLNGTYHMITSNGLITIVNAKEDTFNHTKFAKIKAIKGYDLRLLTKTPKTLEPYAVLNIFSEVHDAIRELKDLQMQHGKWKRSGWHWKSSW